jgi:hypothetical protein
MDLVLLTKSIEINSNILTFNLHGSNTKLKILKLKTKLNINSSIYQCIEKLNRGGEICPHRHRLGPALKTHINH